MRIPGRLKDRCIRKYQSVSEDRSLWPERGLSEFSVRSGAAQDEHRGRAGGAQMDITEP